jgi:hypothetical protein
MTTATRIPQRRGDSVGESDAGRRSIDWQLNRWLEQHYSPRDEMCKICGKWWDVEHECPGSGKTSWGCLLVITDPVIHLQTGAPIVKSVQTAFMSHL